MISFIFDDAFMSHYNNINVFEANNCKCGFAVSKVYADIVGRMTLKQLKELQDKGYEILNHSYSHIPYTGYEIHQSEEEIDQNYEFLTNLGLQIDGFVTPNSQISNQNRLDIIKKHHSYGFTVYKDIISPQDAIFDESDSSTCFDLYRAECSDLIKCKNIIDQVSQNNGLAVFYSHDINASGSVSASDLTELIQYAKQNNLKIVLPSELAKEFSLRKNQEYGKQEDVIIKNNLFSGYFLMNAYNNVVATFNDNKNNHTIVVTSSSSVGDLVVSNTFNNTIPSSNNEEFVFKLNVNSSLNCNMTIGIRAIKKSDGTEICRAESGELVVDQNVRKYKISSGLFTIDEPFYFNLFYRIKNVGSASLEINVKDFFLYSGDMTDAIDASKDVNSTLLPILPTILPSAVRTKLNLQKKESDFVKADGTKITFLQDGFYSIDAKCNSTFSANFNGIRIISAFIINDGLPYSQSDKTVISNRANFDNSITKYFKAGDVVEISLFQSSGVNQSVIQSADYNCIFVTKIN